MKIYAKAIEQNPRAQPSFEMPIELKTGINLLIILHLLLFILYSISGWTGLLQQPWADGTVDDFIRYYLAASSLPDGFQSHWLSSIFTYQFVHFSKGELLLSISMLWLFGHILQSKLGQIKTLMLYFMFVILSAIVFNLSHLIFPIFSGPGGIMEGAFGGTLGIMTITVFLYGKYRLHLSKNIHFPLWKIYVAALLLSFIFVYKHNIAYILVYVSSIYIATQYAEKIETVERPIEE